MIVSCVSVYADAHPALDARELPKKPTELSFTRDGQTIIVSDKFGDVFRLVVAPHPHPHPVHPTRP